MTHSENRMLRVFISSTLKDLVKFRAKVRETASRLGYQILSMEEFDATEHNPMQASYDELAKADLFIGLYAHRYGFIPEATMSAHRRDGEVDEGDGLTSITEWEYKWACGLDLPMRLYLLADEDDYGHELLWPPSMVDGGATKERLEEFKKLLSNSHTIDHFTNAEELGMKLAITLGKFATGQQAKVAASAAAAAAKRTLPRPPDLYARPPYSGAGGVFTGRKAEMDTLSAWAEPASQQAMCVVEAIERFDSAIASGYSSGVRRNEYFGGLARAYAAAGRHDAALRIVTEGCDDYSAAVVLAATGQREDAIERATAYYTAAWAEGEPYVWRFDLTRAEGLLHTLGAPVPQLPPFDTARQAAFPHEEDIRAWVATLRLSGPGTPLP